MRVDNNITITIAQTKFITYSHKNNFPNIQYIKSSAKSKK